MTWHVKSTESAVSAERRRFGTGVALLRRAIATCITFGVLTASLPCPAAGVLISVIDRDGHGVGDAVVTAMPTAPLSTPAEAKPAVMDQRNRTFVPRVLVVSVGTKVEFPNNDSVSHQVYSFSPAKRFQLPLYKGEVHPPITFDQSGLVVLGCNIHDSMVGYIYVTPAPYFGTTGADGSLNLESMPKGVYQIVIWSPYIADAPTSLNRTVQIDGNQSAAVRVQLTEPLRARPEPKPRRRDWEY